ncbi:hypothetical protein CRUP_037565, partial [Coryphaenoides rupestris]
VVLVGVPLWWRTTETYRAWLPVNQINELAQLQLQLSVDVEVVFSRGTLTPEQQKKVPFTLTQDETHKVDEADLSLHTLSESPSGSVVIYVIPETSALLPQSHKLLLAHLEPRVTQVVQAMSFSHADITGALSDRVRLSPGSKESLADSMRSFKSSPGYEITFSLLNPDPKSHRVHWDIEAAVHSYIQPLLTKLAPLANFSIDSQILYYAVLGVNPRLQRCVFQPGAELPALCSRRPPHSALHPRPQEAPSGLQRLPLAALGGDYVNVNINMAKVMGVFLAQLRLMLGVQSSSAPPGFLVEPCGSAGLADWELDRLMWSRTVENVATATTTITSLAQLLDQIGNIVSSTVTSLQLAIAELETGNLGFALQYSKEAILASERAFFDPSLLHLLYFPDDQKFAIYIPLFLPMCVPILLSLIKIASDARERRKKGKKD